MNFKLFITLVCMVFLWIGSQVPLLIFGSIISFITRDIGGTDRYSWFMIAYLIPLAALLPFVGALSDLFGRQRVAIAGQLALVIGAIVTSTASTMNIAIGEWRIHMVQQLSLTNFRWPGLLRHWCGSQRDDLTLWHS